MCTEDGVCYDIVNIVPYIRKYGRSPSTGAPLELKDLTRLHFHKNAAGEYACPVLNKARARARRGAESQARRCQPRRSRAPALPSLSAAAQVFTESTHIVALKPTGNVYCFQAVEELNIKAKNWKCVLLEGGARRARCLLTRSPLASP